MLGLGLLRWGLPVKLLVVAGLVVAAYEGWSVLRPKPWAPNELQKSAADAVCWQAAKAIPAGLPGVSKIAVLRLGGRDADGYVTAKLTECIQRVGCYDVPSETLGGNVMKELGVDAKPVSALAEATKAGKEMGVNGVVFGEVAELASDGTSASIRLDLRVANVQKNDVVFADSYRAKEPVTADAATGVRRSIQATGVVKRLLIWLAFATLLPIILIPMIKRLLEQESNAVNFALLLALTLADLALAYVLCGLAAFGWLPAVAVVGSVVAGGGYNYWLCSTIERLRK